MPAGEAPTSADRTTELVVGSILETVLANGHVTQAAVAPMATWPGWQPTAIWPATRFPVWASMRVTVPDNEFVTHTVESSAAMPSGRFPTEMGWPLGCSV
jgi:hypothetical protein